MKEAPVLPTTIEEFLGKRPTLKSLKALSKDDAFSIADIIHREIRTRTAQEKQLRVELAQLVWVAINVEIGGKTVWQWKGCSSPKEYFALPEIADGVDIGWRQIQRYERVHQVFPIGLGLIPEEFWEVSTDKLEIIIPVVYDEYHKRPKVSRIDAHRWLALAQGNSRSDLRELVSQHIHPTPAPAPNSQIIDIEPEDEPAWVPPPDLDALHKAFANGEAMRAGGRLFEKFVRQGKCILYGREKTCQGTPVTFHHWPVTRGRGATEGMGIPLCPLCHANYQENSRELEEAHLRHITDYLYRTIHVLMELLNEKTKDNRRRSRLEG